MILFLSLTLCAYTVLVAVADEQTAQTAASIWTNKADYQPEEVVTIYGANFTANAPIIVNVTRPDGVTTSSLDGLSGPYAVTTVYCPDGTTDEAGNFATTYQLDGINGTYTVTASDGTNTATTTFTDLPSPLTHFAFEFDSPQIAGDSFSVTVIAKTLLDFTKTNYAGTVTLTSTATSYTGPYHYTYTGADTGVHTFTVQINSPGVWTFTASGPGPLSSTVSTTSRPIIVLPQSIVTAGDLSLFDVDTSEAGIQFRLIFVPNATSPTGVLQYKLTASNPGQFFYNVFYNGWSGSNTITIPYPFVTQGANPVHIYSGASFDGTTFTPGTDITSDFDISGLPVTLSSYGGTFGSTVSIAISLNSPSLTGIVYVEVHLDYGLKGTTSYTPQLTAPGASTKNAIAVTGTEAVTIPYLQPYTFAATGRSSATIKSENVFKNDPGVAGFVLDSSGNPIKNATIKISGTDGKNLISATVKTDVDGWYIFNYKYTGKPTTFMVTLVSATCVGIDGTSYSYTGYTQSQTLKSNSFLIITFTVTLV